MGRLAFSTLGCPEWDFGTVVKKAKEMGYSAIEVRGILDQMQTDKIEIFLPENRNATKKLLEENDLKISNVGTSVMFHHGIEKVIGEGKSAIDTCFAMGIPAIRVFGDAVPPGVDKDTIFRCVADGILELCKYSEEHADGKVQIWLEVHGDFNSAEMFIPVHDLLGDCPGYGMLWDVQHTYVAGVDPVGFFREFKPFIRHTHFKDCILEDGKHEDALPGEGTLPVKEYYELLENGGYTGYYSFEWEKRWVSTLPDPEIAFPMYAALMNSFNCK